MPHMGVTVHLVHTCKEYVEHLFRESLREAQLTALEKRRPRTCGGMGARLHRELTLSELNWCARGALAGALWTADRAYHRGLREDDRCPYPDKGVWEDKSHLLWWCGAWKVAREPFLSAIMLLARALKLGALSAWPPCLRLCGLLPESVVLQNGLSRGPGWKKRCRELHRVSRHSEPGLGETWEEASRQRAELGLAGQQWADANVNPLQQFISKLHGMFVAVLQTRMKKEEEAGLLFPAEKRQIQHDCYPWHQLQLPRQRQQRTEVPELGVLPRDWRWGNDFLPAVLHWLRELHWLPTDDNAPVGHGQVLFMELALDFESHAG